VSGPDYTSGLVPLLVIPVGQTVEHGASKNKDQVQLFNSQGMNELIKYIPSMLCKSIWIRGQSCDFWPDSSEVVSKNSNLLTTRWHCAKTVQGLPFVVVSQTRV